MRPIKVLVVDDSALLRRIVQDILSVDPRFTVVGTARDGIDALEKITKLTPDLITLDVEMPRMNGLQALKEIVRRFRIPVIMLSSLTKQGSAITVEALSLGAVDFIAKPALTHEASREVLKAELLQKAAAAIHMSVQVDPIPKRKITKISDSTLYGATKAVAIGASTGGPRALEAVLLSLPQNLPASVFVTQHMPPNFTRALAQRLDKSAPLQIKEAEHGEAVYAGVVYLAPGDYHMEVSLDKKIRLTQDPPVEHVRPSVTVMMNSVVAAYGRNTLGVVLTGMGKDGAEGMAEIKRQGGSTLAQDEATSVIFSMPRAAIQKGVADQVLPLNKIAGAIIALCGGSTDGLNHGL